MTLQVGDVVEAITSGRYLETVRGNGYGIVSAVIGGRSINLVWVNNRNTVHEYTVDKNYFSRVELSELPPNMQEYLLEAASQRGITLTSEPSTEPNTPVVNEAAEQLILMAQAKAKKQKYLDIDIEELDKGFKVSFSAEPALLTILEEFKVGKAKNTQAVLYQDDGETLEGYRKLVKSDITSAVTSYGLWLFTEQFKTKKKLSMVFEGALSVSKAIDSMTNDVAKICRAAEAIKPKGIYAIITEEEEETDD